MIERCRYSIDNRTGHARRCLPSSVRTPSPLSPYVETVHAESELSRLESKTINPRPAGWREVIICFVDSLRPTTFCEGFDLGFARRDPRPLSSLWPRKGSGKVPRVQDRSNVHDAVSFFHDDHPGILHPQGDAGTEIPP